MARDWREIVNECNQTTINQTKSVIFNKAKSGVLKSYIPNASPIANSTNMRFSQANYTWLGFNGVPNDFPHRELDFGALIWVAYGNRLLYDFGYGEIAKTSSGRPYLIKDGDLQLFDNLALANTLVIEDATIEDYTGGHYNNDLINSSQIYGARGDLISYTLDGYTILEANGSAVYGKNSDEFGWLEYFYRYLIAVDDGSFIVIDTFKTKESRGDANITEYWHVSDDTNFTTCRYTHDKIAVSLEDNNTIKLKPICSMLQREANSTVNAKMVASSLKDGKFEIEPNTITYQNRNKTVIYRKRFKYGSLNPISEDIRVFLLQASADNNLSSSSISKNLCGEDSPCFDVEIGDKKIRLDFSKVDNVFRLGGVDER